MYCELDETAMSARSSLPGVCGSVLFTVVAVEIPQYVSDVWRPRETHELWIPKTIELT